MTDYEFSSSKANEKIGKSPLSPSFVCSVRTIGHSYCCKKSCAGNKTVARKGPEMMRRILIDMNLIDAPAWKFCLESVKIEGWS